MKKCPKCDRSYSDETLNFCLDDGTVLFSENAAATNENILRPTEQQTEILSQETITEAINYKNETADLSDEKTDAINSRPEKGSQPQIIKQGVSPVFAYLSIGLLGLLVVIAGVGITIFVSSNSENDSNSNYEQTNSSLNDQDLTLPELDITGNNSNKSLTDETRPTQPANIPERATSKKENTDPIPVPTATKTQTPAPAPSQSESPLPETGKYYVILGSYQDSANAQKRLMLARSKGLPARIINTSSVPGLRSGLQAVVMGPFTRSGARKILGRAKGVSSDAYIKEG